MQASDSQSTFRKIVPGTFAEKISAEQRSQLFEWLADHTYDEVIDLVASEPPLGFGLKVGKSTLCRFYKAHFREINRLRQLSISDRAAEMMDRPFDFDYRAGIRDSYTQLLTERLWELLSRPIQSADELKKLTVIAEKMKSLDRDKEMMEEVRKEKRQEDLRVMYSTLSQLSAGPAAKAHP